MSIAKAKVELEFRAQKLAAAQLREGMAKVSVSGDAKCRILRKQGIVLVTAQIELPLGDVEAFDYLGYIDNGCRLK